MSQKAIGSGKSSAGRKVELFVLGVNAWALMAAIPAAQAHGAGALLSVSMAAPMLALLIAVLLFHRGDRRGVLMRQGLLYALVPLGLVWARGLQSTPGAITSALVALALVGYVMGVLRFEARALERVSARVSPVSLAVPPSRRWLRQIVIGAVSFAAVSYALLIPLGVDDRELYAAWGPAATEARLLLSAAGGVLAVVVLGVYLGPALRARVWVAPSPQQRRTRSAGWLSASLLGLVVYWLYRRGAGG